MENRTTHPRILLVCCRPKDLLKDSPLPQHEEWFRLAMENVSTKQFRTVYATDESYPELEEFDAVFVGGSKYSVYSGKPWIPALENFVRRVFEARKPYLGVCFGHQVAATALGGVVQRGHLGSEVGSDLVVKSEAGKVDALFDGLEERFFAAQFHRDVVTRLPKRHDVVSLAFSKKYGTQAYAYGDFARTVQFHPEFTAEIMTYIMNSYGQELIDDGLFFDKEHMEDVKKAVLDRVFEANGKRIMMNFYNHFVLKKAKTQSYTHSGFDSFQQHV